MGDVRLSKILKQYGDVKVMQNIDLEVEDGEFVVFVGPSGCGKSTLLRMIAGLEEISGGDLYIGGKRVNDVPPAERGIAMVFQSYALYPHMTLFENMAFGLKLANMDKTQIEHAVHNAAKILHIEHLLDRKPKDLSGGQRQRVAIGRAIVRKPEVFLFDEPLSNLDAALRVRMRYEFAKLHDDLKTTMIYVTHDQVEAMTLADRIVVLSAGAIEQVGTPMELYHYPQNLFVAGFIGSPKMNLIQGEVVEADQRRAKVRLPGGFVMEVAVDASEARLGDTVTLGVRPENFELNRNENIIHSTVLFVESLGSVTNAYCPLEGMSEPLTVDLPGEAVIESGDLVKLGVHPMHCHLFDANGKAFKRHYQMPQKPAS